MIRDGMKLLLTTQHSWCVVGETGDGTLVSQLVRDTQADLLLLDLDLPGCRGIELAQQIKAESPQTGILVVTANQNASAVRSALAAGVDGYMLKHEDGGELLQAISLVLSGIRYVSKALVPALQIPHESAAPSTITAREKEILVLVANGYSSQDIAETLNLSVLTVRKHRQNLMSKLELHNVAELTAYAIRDGLASAGG